MILRLRPQDKAVNMKKKSFMFINLYICSCKKQVNLFNIFLEIKISYWEKKNNSPKR